MSAGLALMVVENYPTAAGIAATIGFGFSAVSLLFLSLGMSVPVTHHMTLIGGVAAVSFLPVVGGNMVIALLIGAVFGMVAAWLGEFFAPVLAHARRHPHRPAGLLDLDHDHAGPRHRRPALLTPALRTPRRPLLINRSGTLPGDFSLPKWLINNGSDGCGRSGGGLQRRRSASLVSGPRAPPIDTSAPAMTISTTGARYDGIS